MSQPLDMTLPWGALLTAEINANRPVMWWRFQCQGVEWFATADQRVFRVTDREDG